MWLAGLAAAPELVVDALLDAGVEWGAKIGSLADLLQAMKYVTGAGFVHCLSGSLDRLLSRILSDPDSFVLLLTAMTTFL